MIEVKKTFSKTELAWFGPLFALFVGIIASILIRRLHWQVPALLLCGAAAVLVAVYYLVPSSQTRIYRGWLLSVAPIGFVVSHLLLALVFYLVLTPIGLVMRLLGHDPMSRAIDRQAASYWIERPKTAEPKHYFRQF
jgi:hypothetical protein